MVPYGRGVKHYMESLVFAGFFPFQLRPRQPGEESALLISDLNLSFKYKGGAKTCRHSALCGMSMTLAYSIALKNLIWFQLAPLCLRLWESPKCSERLAVKERLPLSSPLTPLSTVSLSLSLFPCLVKYRLNKKINPCSVRGAAAVIS
jgi:hypothetical protein